ncbi:MAG: DNA polymerase III subunit delta [Candidatus Marinimicrobia bacterium]|jgi:DNA polymerase-3 subunit delta|nr:DNA polymerase III subunit delta [Candidatus Neomarinimicrobiota bacterium]MBT3634184.1 DNA polymerase III subunit delta [Candidatus Neomarinimicrobiota bacterium]MBT3683221.1 DNA polymerase III subunit delta [Candidatus Neomarinimicrobiota bacterium]MBT3759731.1 DNA polymerase III subunit delta [Candidatus Neomarinimicrobiota bacterium]MBT3895863.1 DNA polymerase III subunit delta [Candidatus Neomarinimicrobiota bacterium]
MTTTITIDQVFSRIEISDFAPIYFLSGDDIYIQDFLINHVSKSYLKDGGRKVLYSIGDDKYQLLIEELYSISIFDDRRLIVVRQVQKITQKGRDELLKYLSNPATEICLIIISDNYYDKNKFLNELKSKSIMVDVRSPLNRNKLKYWVFNILKPGEIQITSGAVDTIIDRQGNSLSNIINEIHIISLMMNESGEIREDIVETIVRDNMEFPIWRFLDALGCKDIVSSVRILHSLCEHGNLAPPIMINLTTFFENMYWMQNKKNIYANYPQLNKMLTGNLYKYSSNYSIDEIINIFKSLRQIDLHSKLTSTSPINLLLPLTIRLCSGAYA